MFENILSSQTKKFLDRIKPENLPKDTYLAGGTAVALRLGHRRSADLDFFAPYEFVEKAWEEKWQKEFDFRLTQRDWQTLIGFIGKVKISLFYYKYPLIGSLDSLNDVAVASEADLAAMKLDTILGRGTKRDLIDIYFLAKKFSLAKLFEYYQKKYCNLCERELMLKKALIYFDEADKDEMPQMRVPFNWRQVKKWLVEEVRKSEK